MALSIGMTNYKHCYRKELNTKRKRSRHQKALEALKSATIELAYRVADVIEYENREDVSKTFKESLVRLEKALVDYHDTEFVVEGAQV